MTLFGDRATPQAAQPYGISVAGDHRSRRPPATVKRPEQASKGNVELVRDAYRLRLDGSRLEETARSIGRFLELLAPDVEFVAATGDAPARQGRRGITNLLLHAAQQWAECSFAVEDARALDASRVLACGTARARPAEKMDIFEVPFVNVWTLHDGRAVRIESFTHRRQAEAAVGIAADD